MEVEVVGSSPQGSVPPTIGRSPDEFTIPDDPSVRGLLRPSPSPVRPFPGPTLNSPDTPGRERQDGGPPPYLALVAVLLVAALLRGVDLAGPSLWYDEVITIRLAREPGPAALLQLLGRIDATRAPLHPLLLQGWLALFGPSDLAARASSALCGLLTVVVVYAIGREASGRRVGLWAAWLCALSPALVRYAREVRMYAWLVLLTCLAWLILLSFRRPATAARGVLFAAVLVALAYSHPLGLFMDVALALAYLVHARSFRLGWRPWLAIQAAAGLAILPWIGRYTDHPPEYLLPRYPIRYLIGMPIEFVGGNSLALAGVVALIVVGLLRRERATEGGTAAGRVRLDDPTTSAILLTWFAVPPLLLYGYSTVAHPIFGPARYTLFVAPAYVLLIARGLAKLPTAPRFAAATVMAALSCSMLRTMVYDPDLRADWRAASAFIRAADPSPTVVVPPVAVAPAGVEPAAEMRYYLGPTATVIATPDELAWFLASDATGRDVWIGVGLATGAGAKEAAVPDVFDRRYRTVGAWRFPGLRLIRKTP